MKPQNNGERLNLAGSIKLLRRPGAGRKAFPETMHLLKLSVGSWTAPRQNHSFDRYIQQRGTASNPRDSAFPVSALWARQNGVSQAKPEEDRRKIAGGRRWS
jgi:hypothetical protein